MAGNGTRTVHTQLLLVTLRSNRLALPASNTPALGAIAFAQRGNYRLQWLHGQVDQVWESARNVKGGGYSKGDEGSGHEQMLFCVSSGSSELSGQDAANLSSTRNFFQATSTPLVYRMSLSSHDYHMHVWQLATPKHACIHRLAPWMTCHGPQSG